MKAFCVNCGKYTDCSIVIQDGKKLEIRGKQIEFSEATAYCSDCLNEVYVASVNDTNVEAREAAYLKGE